MALRKFNIGGQDVMGEEIEFETEKETWNIYILHDGTRIKMKPVPASFIRLDQYNPVTGEPIYLVNATQILSADVPEGLKRKPGE
jgi:hypothetical protein